MTEQELTTLAVDSQNMLDRQMPVKPVLGLVCLNIEFLAIMTLIRIKHPLTQGDWIIGGAIFGGLYLFWVVWLLLVQRRRNHAHDTKGGQ